MSGLAIGVVGALVLGWAELANILTGTANGPAARSTAFAAGWTVIAVPAHPRWLGFSRRSRRRWSGRRSRRSRRSSDRGRRGRGLRGAHAWLIERSHRNWTAPPRRGIAPFLLSLPPAAATGAVKRRRRRIRDT
jgi:hypothetical protein